MGLSYSMEIYVLEYSAKQKAFHIQTEDQMYQTNLIAFTDGKLNDYVPVAKGEYIKMKSLSVTLTRYITDED